MAKKAYRLRESVRKATINFSLSEDEKREIDKAAAAMGISMSAYIRYKLFYERREVQS